MILIWCNKQSKNKVAMRIPNEAYINNWLSYDKMMLSVSRYAANIWFLVPEVWLYL